MAFLVLLLIPRVGPRAGPPPPVTLDDFTNQN
jgi:hypothetical protein